MMHDYKNRAPLKSRTAIKKNEEMIKLKFIRKIFICQVEVIKFSIQFFNYYREKTDSMFHLESIRIEYKESYWKNLLIEMASIHSFLNLHSFTLHLICQF